MISDYASVIASCQDKLFYYSPYNFVKGRDRTTIFHHSILAPWLKKIESGDMRVEQVVVEDKAHYLLIEPRKWDSDFFGFPVYKIITVLYAHNNYDVLKRAVFHLVSDLMKKADAYYFGEFPSEDIYLIQAICEAGFRLTETRIHYVNAQCEIRVNKRYEVRTATAHDVDNLKSVAIEMRQPFDRLHADAAISQDVADAYLAKLIESSVHGFADFVLVPSVGDSEPDAFLACSIYPDSPVGKRVARLGVAAVSNKTRLGWYPKLVTEALHILKNRNVDYVVGDTQASNRLVHRNALMLGFNVGYVTHMFSRKSPSAVKASIAAES